MTTSIIKYALDGMTGKPVHISTISKALAGTYNCAKCGKKMIAIQGDIYEWHFRHYIESNCSGGKETALHKLAKHIILDNSQIKIPGETLVYTNARQEKKLFSIVPDVSVIANGQNIYFEIVVTNPVGIEKELFYTKGEHKCIEIKLGKIDYDIKPNELEELVLRQTHNKTKIFWEREYANTYSVGKDNAPWWKHPIAIAMFILGGIFLLYKCLTWLTNKNSKKIYW